MFEIFSKMKPIDVYNAKKTLGALKIEENKPFFTLPLTIEGKPIFVDIVGEINSEEIFALNQFGQLKMNLNVVENGEIQLLASSLTTTLKTLLEQETLPELRLVVNSFIYNDTVNLNWPQQRKKFKPIDIENGADTITVSPEVQSIYEKVIEMLKKKKKVLVETELYVWARQDFEKHDLIVGFTPRIKKIVI